MAGFRRKIRVCGECEERKMRSDTVSFWWYDNVKQTV